MSQRVRGAEAKLRITVDGILQRGSMFKVKDWTVTPRQDITETSYTGEDEDDLDFQHHGFDISWSVDLLDRTTIALLTKIIQREQQHGKPPEIVVTTEYTFRDDVVGSGLICAYHDNLVIKQGDESASGRKENVSIKYEAKCKQRDVIEQ